MLECPLADEGVELLDDVFVEPPPLDAVDAFLYFWQSGLTNFKVWGNYTLLFLVVKWSDQYWREY
jgi:hypothetical protein